MIRAAAKNYKSVAVVTDASMYGELIDRIENGTNDEAYRFECARRAFGHTAAYDARISNYLNGISGEEFPEKLTLTFEKKSPLRYGENPSQSAAFYVSKNKSAFGIESAEFLHGKELSYNNIGDAQAAVALIKEFNEPACAAIKHSSPCGAAIGETVYDAFLAAYECDPQSIFGGIVSFNRAVDARTASKMKELFLDVIIAPSYEEEALRILQKKKNLRLLALPGISQKPKGAFEFKSVGGGLLVQQTDKNEIESENFNVVTKITPSASQMKDLIFGMKVARHVKSNAIVVAKDGRTLGIGGGQVSRVWAAEAAIGHALSSLDGAVLASDALFPFPDVVELCAKAGVKAIIQPGGSKNDAASVEACDKRGIAMVFTGMRHFKH